MATQTASYIEAIRHLPIGGVLTVSEVSWEEYEQLLTDLGDDYGVRINYFRGRLEIMSLSQFHEMYAFLLHDLALMTADRLGITFESRGSMTLKEKIFEGGAEPDGCFYLQHSSFIIGKRSLDLKIDPPPDVIVEIDVSHGSRYKFDFYANLGIPEIWLYDEKTLGIYLLNEGGYVQSNVSLAFPILTSDALTQSLEQSKTEGQSGARQRFSRWLKAQLDNPPA